MTASRMMMRRMVLSKLYNHLREHYSFGWAEELFIDGNPSIHDIDAILAFKSDIQLEELRIALDRIEEGTFGACLRCKQEIEETLLDADPSRRLCAVCEREFHRTPVRTVVRTVDVGVHV